MNNRAAALSDLIVLIALVLLGSVVCIAAIAELDTRETRVQCAMHLRMIGQAMLIYGNENRGAYPRTARDAGDGPLPTWGTPYEQDPGIEPDEKANPFGKADAPGGKHRPAQNDVTAAMFLLLRTQDITPEVFVCPATPQRAWDLGGGSNTALSWSNWRGNEGLIKHLSYSLQNPYPSNAATMAGFIYNTVLPREFALAADMNPGSDALLAVTANSPADRMRLANSPNHSRRGQNVLFGDGHVDFAQSPFVGEKGDNIYTFGKSDATRGGEGIVGPPGGAGDSILLPTGRHIGSADENGDFIDRDKFKLLSDQQQRDVQRKLMGSYAREQFGATARLEVTEDRLVRSSEGKREASRYRIVGMIGDELRVHLTPPGANHFLVAHVSLRDDGSIIIDVTNYFYSGDWSRE